MRGATMIVLLISACRTASPAAPSEPSAAAPEAEATAPASKPADPFVAIAKVKANAIHAPDPSQDQLATTEAGRAKKPVSTTVSFCVDTDGMPQNVVTSEESGDEKVDWICRNTVADWRFTPFLLEGKPVRTCSRVQFKINFK